MSCNGAVTLILRLKWPYTEWETAPTQKSRENGKENEARNGQKMAAEIEKWPKNGQYPILGPIFPFRRPFFGHFGLGAILHFLSHFLGILVSGRFPILYMATSIATLILLVACFTWSSEWILIVDFRVDFHPRYFSPFSRLWPRSQGLKIRHKIRLLP